MQGYRWEDTQLTRWAWSQEAERFHALDPKRYLSWDADPELSDDGPTREDPMLGALQKLEQRLDNISRSPGSDQQPVLEAVVTLSQMLSAFDEASRTRESQLQEDIARMSENITNMLGDFRQNLSRIGGRITIALVLIMLLGIMIAFR